MNSQPILISLFFSFLFSSCHISISRQSYDIVQSFGDSFYLNSLIAFIAILFFHHCNVGFKMQYKIKDWSFILQWKVKKILPGAVQQEQFWIKFKIYSRDVSNFSYRPIFNDKFFFFWIHECKTSQMKTYLTGIRLNGATEYFLW